MVGLFIVYNVCSVSCLWFAKKIDTTDEVSMVCMKAGNRGRHLAWLHDLHS